MPEKRQPTNPPKSPFKRVRRRFDRDGLKRVCEMHETEFPAAYDMAVTPTPASKFWDADYPGFYAYLDRGSDILAVAHLDTVMAHERRTANYIETAAGPVVYSGALDDRLGAYTILELLPDLGVNVDVLLTVGEESGQSTAEHFTTEKDYLWMIEFDRGGSDVVMYQYEDYETEALVKECGARVGNGSFSDIAFLEHLEVKGFNWGVGYQDYHGPRSHAYLNDYWDMVSLFLKFHETNATTYLPHDIVRRPGLGMSSYSWLDDPDDLSWEHEDHDPEDPNVECQRCEEDIYDRRFDDHGQAGDIPVVDINGDLVSEDFSMVNRQLTGGWTS